MVGQHVASWQLAEPRVREARTEREHGASGALWAREGGTMALGVF